MARSTVTDGPRPGAGDRRLASRARAPRLRRADRREALLDAAVAIAAELGVDAVSMETVASRARVSRPLLYKHFANASELLAAAYKREMATLDQEVGAAVAQAGDLEGAVRALVQTVIDEAQVRGTLLVRLIRAGARDSQTHKEQRAREARLVRHFSQLVADELDVSRKEAMAACRVLLTGIDSIIHQWQERPTPEQRTFLEDLFVRAVMGGLHGVAGRVSLRSGN